MYEHASTNPVIGPEPTSIEGVVASSEATSTEVDSTSTNPTEKVMD